MRFFALIFSFFCLVAVSFADQSDSIRQSSVQNGRHQRHSLNQEQTREERGTFRSPNSNSDQNPDKGSKAKRGVSRFGEAPIEREMTGNVSPVEAARSSGAVAPTYAAAQPYSAAQSVAAAFPAAPVQAVPAVAAVGRKRRATSRNSAVEVGIGPGQSR